MFGNESLGIIAVKIRLQSLFLALERRAGNFTEIELALYPETEIWVCVVWNKSRLDWKNISFDIFLYSASEIFYQLFLSTFDGMSHAISKHTQIQTHYILKFLLELHILRIFQLLLRISDLRNQYQQMFVKSGCT